MSVLKDKVAIVIGAAGKDNMAQVIARRFAREGARPHSTSWPKKSAVSA